MPDQPDKFKAVRDAIPLLDHIQRCCAVKIERPNAATTHVNPCPLCGHNDCCTLYVDTNSFKCFSAACDKAGDIISFEKFRLGLDSNLAAAEALIDQYNINIDAPATIRRTAPPTPERKPPEKPPLPQIDPSRARALRNLMTCYYHDQLMANADALKYQTAIRGHAPETLIREQIGWSPGTWAMADAAAAAGYTKQDLAAIGLLRQTEKGFSLVIPAGLYVYPHRNADGHTLHYTLKDPGKKRKWQPVKAAADSEWLTFGQGAMDAEEYWIVEGEDDRLTLLDLGIQNVCAIIGNTKVTAIRDHAAETASGKTIYMAFDPDDAGRAYAQKFTRALTKAGATVKSVMPSLEQWDDDIDALLRKAENPAGLLEQIIKNAQILTTPPPSAPAPPANPMDVLGQFTSFDVLGEMANNDIAFWSMDQGKAKTYKIAIKNLTLDQLVQIGGQEINDKTCRTLQEQTDTGRIMFSTLKKIIIIHASRTQLGNMPHLGQGIHYLKSGERLLIVNGKSGWVWDGQQLTEHQYPLIEKQFMAFEEGAEWVDMNLLATALAAMNREKAYATLTQFLDILKQWEFEGTMDRITIAGWIIAQIIQGVWDWRPHLWLSGTQGSGKSKLLKTLKDIFDKYMAIWEANITSPAGLRQKMQEAQRMTCLDEFEESKNNARNEIIEILRSAGRTGEGAKGSATGAGGQVYALKHMVMCCSIEVGLHRAAEKSRFLLASTLKKPDHPTPESPATATCEQLKHDLIAMAIWGFRTAKRLVKRRTASGENRFTESIAVPYSMLAICMEDPQKSLNDNLQKYIAEFERRNSGTVLEDEYAVLQDILLASVRVTETHEDTGINGLINTKLVIVERTVGQILSADTIPPDHADTLQTCGLKLTPENELFVAHELCGRKLLKNTRWRNLSILEILRRLPLAEHKQRTIGGTRAWGILIPERVWKGNEAES